MTATIAWGAASGGRRQHAYHTYPSAPWWPKNPPRSLCMNGRSPEMRVIPAADVPRCRRCEHIAALQIERGFAAEPVHPYAIPVRRDVSGHTHTVERLPQDVDILAGLPDDSVDRFAVIERRDGRLVQVAAVAGEGDTAEHMQVIADGLAAACDPTRWTGAAK
jgi:hypothetical protein